MAATGPDSTGHSKQTGSQLNIKRSLAGIAPAKKRSSHHFNARTLKSLPERAVSTQTLHESQRHLIAFSTNEVSAELAGSNSANSSLSSQPVSTTRPPSRAQ